MSDRSAIKLVISSTALSWLHKENSVKLTGGRLDCAAYSYLIVGFTLLPHASHHSGGIYRIV